MIKKTISLILLVVLISPSMFSQSKMAYVNTQSLLDSMPSRKKADVDLKRIQAESESTIKDLYEEREKSRMNIEKNQKTWSKIVLDHEIQQYQKLEMKIQQTEVSLQRDLQDLAVKLQAPIEQRLIKAVNIVAERKKLNYVIAKEQVIYSKGGLDITEEVRKEVMRLEAVDSPK